VALAERGYSAATPAPRRGCRHISAGNPTLHASAAGDTASLAVTSSIAKPVAEDVKASLKHVIPKGLGLGQQDLHCQEAGKRDYPRLDDAHWTPALRSNSTFITR
jgi:hypothetical protein